MNKGKSDMGVRMKESRVDESVPVADATAGDEGIDDAADGKPFIPGQPEQYAAERSNDVDPQHMEQNTIKDAPQRTSIPPGVGSTGGQRRL
jgi:hypothetical protein